MKNSKQPIAPAIYTKFGSGIDDYKPLLDGTKTGYEVRFGGLTKIEYFSLHLMQGILSGADRHSQVGDCQEWNYEHLSQIAIKAANALLKELEPEQNLN